MKSLIALILVAIPGMKWVSTSSAYKVLNFADEASSASTSTLLTWVQCMQSIINSNNSKPQAGRQLGAQPWWKTRHKQASNNGHISSISNKFGDEIVAKSTASSTKQSTPSKRAPIGALPADPPSSLNGPGTSSSSATKGAYANGGDGFFKGNSGVSHGSAAWDFLNDHHNTLRWPSSWRRQLNGSDALSQLCGPFQHWLQHSYIPRARQRAPVVCSMVPHQGLGDQFKGVTRCWAAALITQRPLYFDHGKSR